MGTVRALSMAAAVVDGLLSQDAALADHLQHNHYPPVSLDWLPHCIDAIAAVQEGDAGRIIRGMTAAYIVEGLHLEAFIEAAP